MERQFAEFSLKTNELINSSEVFSNSSEDDLKGGDQVIFKGFDKIYFDHC